MTKPANEKTPLLEKQKFEKQKPNNFNTQPQNNIKEDSNKKQNYSPKKSYNSLGLFGNPLDQFKFSISCELPNNLRAPTVPPHPAPSLKK